MIVPIPAPDIGDPWDTDPNVQAVWRERERRQRTVRLLMMFLLMLLLMDGEEQSARRRSNDPNYSLRKRKNAKKNLFLEDTLYDARRDQEDRILKVTRSHPRFLTLLGMNDNVNIETQIRKWADLQQLKNDEQEIKDEKVDKAKQADPEDEKSVFHYPWNSTGFYRGEWVREGIEEEEEDDDPKAGEEEARTTKYLTALELEKPMTDRMREMEESIGVYLLPKGTKIKMHNYTVTKAEQAALEAVAAALKAKARKSSPWMIFGQPELNEVVATLEDDNDPPPQVTLTKSQGRAAFQFYSRSVPAMKELSLIDGFVKLYDSNTVGYSTRRDTLLRVKGVIIHSIGRISLVSNSAPGRSALIISEQTKQRSRNKERQSEEPYDTTEDTEVKRRRLFEMVDRVDEAAPSDVDQIREDVLSLYDFDAFQDDGEEWDLMESFQPEGPFFSDSSGFLFDFLNKRFWEPDSQAEKRTPKQTRRRRLSEALLNATDNPNITVSVSFNETNSTLVGRRTSELRTPGLGDDIHSNVVIPYPFVPDDKFESIRKAKTPAARRMPAREQLLEANAGRCEFEINLDVKEVQWTIGEWKTLMARHVLETKQLDPSLHKKEPEEGENEDEEDEGASKAAHLKRKHESSSGQSEHRIVKSLQDQAVVMAMSGTIQSPNCDFMAALNATAIRTDWEHTTGKAINYSFYMMLTCLTQIVVLLRQLLHTQHQSAATKVSLLCVGWQTVLDALLCLGHIYLSLAMQPLFTAFASVAFFKLLIFCVIEMKYMAIIIQARNSANGGHNTTELLRRQVAMLHLRFYVALVIAFLGFFYAGQQYRTIYMLVLYSFWIPQIIQNAITETKRPLHTYYIYGMSITRCVAPLYMFAVPNNFLKEVYPDSPTNYFMVEVLILWIAFQTAVLIAQGKYGARFMIPARFLPPKFDYHRPIPPSLLPPEELKVDLETDRTPSPPPLVSAEPPVGRKSTGTRNRLKGGRGKQGQSSVTMTTESVAPPVQALDCVICCNGIDYHNRKGYMLAPCDHLFHKDCLIQWMEVKMECPICRQELPAL